MENEKESVTINSSGGGWVLHWFLLPFLITVLVLTLGIGNAWSASITPWLAYPLAVVPAVILAAVFTWICGDSPGTMVELGIGATISCALVVISVSTFAMAGEKNRTTVCMSNERKLGVAFLQYAADYDDTMPPAQKWGDITLSYIPGAEQKNILCCPDAPKLHYGYAVNGDTSGEQLAITYKAEIPLLYDSVAAMRNAVDGVAFASLPMTKRHSKGNCVIWGDGHVSCLHPTDRKQEKRLLANR